MEILGNKDTRSGFGEGLAELGDENENVVALCADLTGSLKMNAFQNAHPGWYCRSQHDELSRRYDHRR